MSEDPAIDRLIKSAYAALSLLQTNMPPHVALQVDEETIVGHALLQHFEHLKTHQIQQKSLDAFKFICWVGGSLIEGLERGDGEEGQCSSLLDSILQSLEELLIVESQAKLILPKTSGMLLKSLLLQERKGNGKHGIWMNGLYASFHCCTAAYEEGIRVHAAF